MYIYNEDCITGMPKYIKNNSVDLIIADPPYFKVVNEKWDYLWRTESDYLEWSDKWINRTVKILRLGGSFYLFGYFRILSKLIPILEKNGLELRQQIIIDKGIRAISGRATKNYKIFPNVTESILFLIKDNKCFVKRYLKRRKKLIVISSQQINEQLGVKSNGGGMWSIYTGNNICEQFPTEEMWNKLEKILRFNIDYKKISQTFNPIMGLTDVWKDIDFYKEKRFHPTQKPIKLIERIIKASSNKGDLILDPFMGSGNTAIASIQNDRKFKGFEIDKKYYSIINQRIKNMYNSENINELF